MGKKTTISSGDGGGGHKGRTGRVALIERQEEEYHKKINLPT